MISCPQRQTSDILEAFRLHSPHYSDSTLEYWDPPEIQIRQQLLPELHLLLFKNPASGTIMATASAEEMENLQRLSDQYQPNLPGPLIGPKLPITALVMEYAQADATFVAKTQALCSTHSSYRQVKGDGQCGWRGVVFAYFELLLQSSNLDLLTQESTRIHSFEDTMRMIGLDYDILADMFEYTWELFEDIRKAIEIGNKSDEVILRSMNDENVSNSIVYHFKMMTGSYMQLHADQYEPFLEGISIEQYRLERIDPTAQEIDQIGLQALTDGVIAPAGIAVDVSYLDRSVGDEVTPHQFVPNSHGWPTIRLLYRPGHYDLIYKELQSIQVFRQAQPVHNTTHVDHLDQNADLHAFMFPEMMTRYDGADASGGQFSAPEAYGTYPRQSHYYMSDGSYQVPAHSVQESYQIHSPPISQQYHEPMIQSQQLSPQSQQLPSSPNSYIPPSPGTSTSTSTAHAKPDEPQIRYNKEFFDYNNLHRNKSIALTPEAYGSSVTSPAHFKNLEFQPEMWSAKEDYNKS